MSQKVLGGGLLVGVGYVLYQLFNNDEDKEVNSDLELKDVTKNILKGKNDFDLGMEKVDLDKEINTEVKPTSSVEETSTEEIPVQEETSAEEIPVQEETLAEEIPVQEVQEEAPVQEEAQVEEETSLEDLVTDDSNTIERIVRI